MDEGPIEVEVDREGQPRTVRTGLSANDVVGIIRALEGEPDVTVTISREGADERLLVAISGSLAFLGLIGPDEVFQFVGSDKGRGGTQRLMIGGQSTDIKSQYVLCVERAASVAYEWLNVGRQSSLGAWERR